MNLIFLAALASLFYLIPFIIGRGVVTAIWRHKKEDSFADFPGYFALGTGIIFAWALITQYLLVKVNPVFSFQTIFFDFVYGLTCISLLLNAWRIKSLTRLFRVKVLSVIGLTVLFSAVSYFIWTWKSPYSLNWDLYEHQTLVHLITQGHFNYYTSQMSDTFGFNSYPPVFHLLMAVSQFPGHLQPTQIIQYWSVIGFFHLWLVSLASYAFAYAVTKNKGLSALSCLLGTLTFESVIAFTSFFLLPQTLAAVVFITAFTALIWRKKSYVSLSPIEVVLTTVLLVLLHYVIGGLAALILFSTFIYFFAKPKLDKLNHHFPLSEVIVLAVLAGFFGSQFINLNALNHGEAASYVFSLPDKFKFMLQIYGLLLVLALPLGIFDAIKTTNWLKKYLLFLVFCLLMMLMSQLPYALKFFVLARWFILFFSALGLWTLIEKQSTGLARKISFAVVFLGLSLILVLNSLLWKQGLNTDNQISHVSQDELAAAQFLKENYADQSLLVISDPATQYIIEGLSGVNSPGGSFANPETRNQVVKALSEANPEAVVNDFSLVHDQVDATPEHIFVIFSGRLFLWKNATEAQRLSFDYNVWESRQLKFTDYQWLSQLSTDSFPMIYQNKSLQIRQIR